MAPKGKVIGLYQKTSARFGFDAWSLDVVEEMNALIARIIREGLDLASKEYKCYAWFPIAWAFGDDKEDGVGGPPPEDPTTIYVELPLGAHEDESPRWTFHLSALVDDLIDGAECGGVTGAPISEEHMPSFRAVRDSLRALADRIDAALGRPQRDAADAE